jgi:carboxyl-terminal processing protease
MADEYRPSLNKIKSMKDLNNLFKEVNFEARFLSFAAANGIKPGAGEWEESKDLINNHIKAFIGRYSPLDDNAFYPILLEKDNMVIAAIEQ